MRIITNGSTKIQMGNECKLYDGGRLILTGYITGLSVNLSGELVITGSSKTWLLTQSLIPNEENSSLGTNLTLLNALNTICSWVKIDVVEQIDVALEISGGSLTPLNQLNDINLEHVILERDHTLLENILDIINPYGLYLKSDIYGRLIIFSSVVKNDKYNLQPVHIVDATMNCSEAFRGQTYQTISQATIRTEDKGYNSSNTLKSDSPLPIARRLWDESTWLDTTKFKNRQMANFANSSTISISLTLDQFLPATVGDIISFNKPMFKLSKSDFVVESIEYILDQTGIHTFFILSDSSKYDYNYNGNTYLKSGWVSY